MGRPLKDIAGQRFGELTVLSLAPRDEWKANGATWICECDCGVTKHVVGGHLRSGTTVSCGHKREAELAAANERRHAEGREIGDGITRHGMYLTPTYRSWQAMKDRCHNPNNTAYHYYGGRGVTVCDRWRNSFEAFLEDMGERPEGMTLDRIDPYGDYTPDNTRWADWETQSYNKRSKVANAS